MLNTVKAEHNVGESFWQRRPESSFCSLRNIEVASSDNLTFIQCQYLKARSELMRRIWLLSQVDDGMFGSCNRKADRLERSELTRRNDHSENNENNYC